VQSLQASAVVCKVLGFDGYRLGLSARVRSAGGHITLTKHITTAQHLYNPPIRNQHIVTTT
jgi:hypothetical protein